MKLIANAATMSKKSEEQNRLDQRRNRFQEQPKITIPKSLKSDQPMIGTCEKLEKSYLRLTSAPDPSTIRPLSILEKAFSFVMNTYQTNNDWSYTSSQLKSIRQDLMVQNIRNDFAVLVYEENARIALKMADRDQFIQCQTQLEILYDSACNRTHLIEFLIYRLLYSLLLNDCKKCNRILLDIDQEKSSSKDLNTVLQFSSAVRRRDYVQMFVLYQSLPELAQCLVKIFLDQSREQYIEVVIRSFAPTFPIEILTKLLAYPSITSCQEHLRSLGILLIDNSMLIDCKGSRTDWDRRKPVR